MKGGIHTATNRLLMGKVYIRDTCRTSLRFRLP